MLDITGSNAMSTAVTVPKTNGITSPRLLKALRDPRIQGILKAVGRCAAAGNRRENMIAGRYAWPRHLVALLDELVLYRVPTEDILAVGTAIRDAIFMTVYVGTSAPAESTGVALSRESRAEAEANAVANLLIDDPDDLTLRRRLLDELAEHAAEIERCRIVLLRDLPKAA